METAGNLWSAVAVSRKVMQVMKSNSTSVIAEHTLTRLRNIKNVTRCRDSRSEKAEKQGRDDSIKQFST